MKKSIASTMGALAFGAILGAGAAPNAVAQEGNSGFLRDYERLKESKDTAGKTIRAWVSPKLTPDNYNAIMLDPLVFYPEPAPSKQVSADTLQQMLKYSNDALRASLAKRFNVVDRPGPGVLRLRVGISSVAAKEEGLKPYQYVPLAFIATMASRAASGAPQRAAILIEVEGTDSVSGQLMALRTKVGTGERLKDVGSKEVITFDNVKPLLDELAAAALPELGKYVKGK